MAGTPRARPGQLKCQWGKLADTDPDLVYVRGDGVPRADAHMLHHLLQAQRWHGPLGDKWAHDPSFLEELDARGYDVTTLRISVEKKQPA